MYNIGTSHIQAVQRDAGVAGNDGCWQWLAFAVERFLLGNNYDNNNNPSDSSVNKKKTPQTFVSGKVRDGYRPHCIHTSKWCVYLYQSLHVD